MKEISKVKVYIKKSIKSIIMERHILKHLHHNFITNLYFSFQDKDNLYLILDYYSGGDLRFYLNKNVQFTEEQIKFLISNIILSLRYLHKNNILHRDIKPENLVFDDKGYLNLADFGISKKIKKNKPIKDRSGTPSYLSPEIILKKNQTFVCDYFALGIILYELIFLKRPFNGKNKQEIADNILHIKIKLKKNDLPNTFSESQSANELIDFLNKILKRKTEERLGAKGIKELMEHPWLKETDWKIMELKIFEENEIPFIPFPGDNFDYLKINNKIHEKDQNYNSYLNLVNNSTLFDSFYFNSFSSKNRKVLSSNNLRHKEISEQSDNNTRIIHSQSLKTKKNIKNSINETKNESSGSNEYTLSEYIFEDDDDFIFNRDSENNGRFSDGIKSKRYTLSPKRNMNDPNKRDKNRNTIF